MSQDFGDKNIEYAGMHDASTGEGILTRVTKILPRKYFVGKAQPPGLSNRRSEARQQLEDHISEEGQQLYEFSWDDKGNPVREEPTRLRLLSPIAKGGMGEIYEVQDPIFGLRFLAKRAIPSLVQSTIEQEAKLQALFTHPNINTISRLLSDQDGNLYSIIEDLRGDYDPLDDRIGSLNGYEFKILVDGLFNAVATLHKAGVLHCDIKPKNVMLHHQPKADYDVKLIDFGIAATKETALRKMPLGSIDYMAPELFGRQTINSIESDVYALGMTLYECIVGKNAVEVLVAGNKVNVQTKIHIIHNEEFFYPKSFYTRCKELGIDGEKMKSVLQIAMAKTPQERFGSIDKFYKELSEVFTVENHEPKKQTGTNSSKYDFSRSPESLWR